MTDIAAKLKSPATIFYEYAADKGELLREAADTIEALRAENEKIRADTCEECAKIIEKYVEASGGEGAYLYPRRDGCIVGMQYAIAIREHAARAAVGETE